MYLLGCVTLSQNIVRADDEAAQIAQMAELAFTGACDDAAYLSCIGVKPVVCKSTVKKILDDCRGKLPKKAIAGDINTDAWEKCTDEKMKSAFNVAADLKQRCHEAHGGAAPPAGLAAQSNELAAQALRLGVDAYRSHAQVLGTSDIHLPIYPKASIASRMDAAELAQFYQTPTTVSEAVFTSTDPFEAVVNFYRKNLKNFHEHNSGASVIFVDDGNSKSNALDPSFYLQHQHVIVSAVEGGSGQAMPMGMSPGTKTTINIGFRK